MSWSSNTTTSNSSMSRPCQHKTAPHSQKNAQMTVWTVIWASMCMPHCHDSHKLPPWTMNWGSRPVLSPPCMFFFSFFFLFFMLTWNFNEIDYVIRHHHYQLHLDESTMSTHQDGTLQHKKMPKWWFILSFGPQYVHCEFHVTTWLQITTMDDERGSRQVLSPQCMLLYFFYFYTNVNFLLNIIDCDTTTTTTTSTCQGKLFSDEEHTHIYITSSSSFLLCMLLIKRKIYFTV